MVDFRFLRHVQEETSLYNQLKNRPISSHTQTMECADNLFNLAMRFLESECINFKIETLDTWSQLVLENSETKHKFIFFDLKNYPQPKYVFAPHYLLMNRISGFYNPPTKEVGLPPECVFKLNVYHPTAIHEITHYLTHMDFENEKSNLFGFYKYNEISKTLDEPLALYMESKSQIKYSPKWKFTIHQAFYLCNKISQSVQEAIESISNATFIKHTVTNTTISTLVRFPKFEFLFFHTNTNDPLLKTDEIIPKKLMELQHKYSNLQQLIQVDYDTIFKKAS